jgi:hypothetical protein
MHRHGKAKSNDRQRYICSNRDCESYGKTSVERFMPTSAEVMRSCVEVFPSLKWELLQSNETRIQCWGKLNKFTVELLVLREIGVTCWFVEKRRGEVFRCDRREKDGVQPVGETLLALKKTIELYGGQIMEVLGGNYE